MLWRDIEPEDYPITDLTPCQKTLSWEALLNENAPSFSGDEYPHIVEEKDKSYISDGHHRIMRHLLRGDLTIKARVLRARSSP